MHDDNGEADERRFRFLEVLGMATISAMTKLKDVRFELTDLNAELVHEWTLAFKGCDNVVAAQGSILDAKTSALVSPANSFGFMDGGLDLVLSQYFGWQLEEQVRQRILDDFDGELPVGQAIVVPTNHEQIPWLISAPTMRVPMNVEHTAHAHLAFRGILRAVRAHNAQHPDSPINSVVCPGLGTGEGRMPESRCAKQMRHAYNVCVHGEVLKKGGLAAAVRDHMMLVDYVS